MSLLNNNIRNLFGVYLYNDEFILMIFWLWGENTIT